MAEVYDIGNWRLIRDPKTDFLANLSKMIQYKNRNMRSEYNYGFNVRWNSIHTAQITNRFNPSTWNPGNLWIVFSLSDIRFREYLERSWNKGRDGRQLCAQRNLIFISDLKIKYGGTVFEPTGSLHSISRQLVLLSSSRWSQFFYCWHCSQCLTDIEIIFWQCLESWLTY